MPQHARQPFSHEELRGSALHAGFGFTDGVPLLKVPALASAKRPPMQGGGFDDTRTVLYDLARDPGQSSPIEEPDVERRFLDAVVAEMRRHEAPEELYRRFDLEVEA